MLVRGYGAIREGYRSSAGGGGMVCHSAGAMTSVRQPLARCIPAVGGVWRRTRHGRGLRAALAWASKLLQGSHDPCPVGSESPGASFQRMFLHIKAARTQRRTHRQGLRHGFHGRRADAGDKRQRPHGVPSGDLLGAPVVTAPARLIASVPGADGGSPADRRDDAQDVLGCR